MLSHVLRKVAFSLLSISMTLLSARGTLVLDNYSPANPIQIMCVGDSITDDCVFNGAWRQFLQPLLETNGYPFRFVGRYNSAAMSNFTQTAHEGFCGSVVGPPGVFSAHGYAATDCYLQKIVSDALTSNIPDLILIMIGANDIGRGRNPYQVATNDMPTLLDIIFSNAPNANVILGKMTTLSNASLGYGAYFTNVPIYNSVLQTMVNQRRALGQNVSLADFFSVVDYSTMFNGDHLHPNLLGLQAIAQEWLTRIRAITVPSSGPVVTSLLHGGEVWKYLDTGQDPGTNWVQPGFDDSAWSSGIARLGYGDLSVATTVSYGGVATNRYITTYFRHAFVVPDNVAITNLNFRLARTDGAVVWLNGQEAFRTNMRSGPITYTNQATRNTIYDGPWTFYPTNIPVASLPPGTNLLAVEEHLWLPTRVTLGMDLELLAYGSVLPPPSLSIELSGGNAILSWPVAGSSGFSLFSSTNPGTPSSWLPFSGPLQTNAGQVLATEPVSGNSGFFRLQKP